MNLVEKMKVVKTGYYDWDIEIEGKAVARIETFHGIRGNTKNLFVLDRNIDKIRNQKEACEKLQEFFIDIRKSIETIQKHIDELDFGCGVFKSSSYVCYKVLREKKEELENTMVDLKKYDYLGERNMTINDLDLAVTVTLNNGSIIEYSQNEENQWFWTLTDPKGNKKEGDTFPTIEDCYSDVRERFGNR